MPPIAEQEHTETRSDVELLKEAGVIDGLIDCLRESGYGAVEYADFAQFQVRVTHNVYEPRETGVDSSDQYAVHIRAETVILFYFDQIEDNGYRRKGSVLFSLEDPYPEVRGRDPFWMRRDYESTGTIREPEKARSMGIVSADISSKQLKLIRELEEKRIEVLRTRSAAY